MRQSRLLALRRLALFSCLLLCCALAADDSAPAYAGSLGQRGAYPGGSHADPVAGFARGLSAGAFGAPSFLRAGSPLLAAMPGGTPYTGTPLPIPGTIQAEDFDNGAQGVAYNDTTAANEGGFYRSSGVDITSTYVGPNVGWTQTGEWLEYTVNVSVTSTYRFEVIAATPYSYGNVHIKIDGVDVTGNMPIPNTGGWGNYGAATKSGVLLTAGTHVMRVSIDGFAFLFDRVQVTNEQTPYGGTPWAVPGTIQAEDFDNGGQGVAYNDTTTANEGGFYRTTGVDITSTYVGPNVGWTQVGEWMKYTVNVSTTGTYNIEAYAASPQATGALRVYVDNVDVTGLMPVPNTGSWSTYAAVTKTGVSLTAGQHVLKVSIDGYGFLLDRIRVVPPAPAAPTGLAAAAISTTQINLSWADNSSNETDFKVERKTGAGGAYAEVATVGAGVTSYSNTGLPSNTQHFYRVRATNTGGNSAYSNESSATTQNLPPTVSLTAPTTGSSYTAPATVTLTATAADADGGVAKVEFYQGATKVGEDTAAPFEFNWTNVAAGSYSLTAKATDSSGAQTTSAAVNVTVSLPTVTVAATDASASEQGPDAGTFTVTRSGAAGLTDSPLTVNFTAGGTATAGDYTLTPVDTSVTIPAGAASQTVTVTPVDDALVEQGGETVVLTLSANAAYTVGTPSSATLTIADNDTLPTVTVSATDAAASENVPDAGTFTVARTGGTGSALTVNYALSGTAANVADYGTLSGSVTIPAGSSSQTVTVSPVDDTAVETGGETVVLTLSNNASYIVGTPSAATVAIADNDTYPPTASITSPLGGAIFTAPATIEIAATASDADGTVSKVEFLRDGVKIGEDSTYPYAYPWVNPPAGAYSLTARAIDNANAAGTSAPVTVVVNTPPSVSITSPADNTAVYAGASVQLAAAASDPDPGGGIAQVEFRRGAESLGVANAAPYAMTWQNVPEGSHIITAVATDDRGAQTTSTAVHVVATDFTAARLDPENRTGTGGVDLYSRNFNWSLPLVALPGRSGLDLGLSLSYNSLVWTKSGNYVLFDGDGGWPAPGFRLGFAVVQQKFYDTQAQKYAYMLISPSGARVSLRQRTDDTTVYEAGDSSYMQLTEEQNGSLTLVAPGGTRTTYWFQGGAFRCTEIKDRNGNFITLAYTAAGTVDNVTDTLGRLIDFEYHADGYLKDIKQTWHREEESGGTTQVVEETYYWARFEYDDLTLDLNFHPGTTPRGAEDGQIIRVLKRVKLADDSSYVFDYTTWGQVYKIEGRAKDTGLLNYVSLGLPLDAGQPQGDCPRPSERRDWATYWNGDTNRVGAAAEEAVTAYEVTDGATWQTPENGEQNVGRLVEVETPDGTLYRKYAHSTGWDEGLVRLAEVWSGGMRKKWTSTAWTQDDENLTYAQNPRVRETNVYDSNENGSLHSRRRTEVVYTSFGLPEDVKEYDETAATVLRRTHTEYVPESVNANGVYTAKRIIGLPSRSEVYGREGGQEKLFSKVTYEYDLGGQFLAAPEADPAEVSQHDEVSFPAGFLTRGLLCRTRRWDVTDRNNQSKSIASEAGYNTLGSAVFTRDALNHSTVISYADSDGGARLAYPTRVTDPEGFTSSIWYNYDMGAVVKTETPKPNVTTDQPGPELARFYDAAGRPVKVKRSADGASTRWEYGASGLFAKQMTRIDTDKAETFAMSVTDGAGRVVGRLGENPGVGTGYVASRYEYDRMGRVLKQFIPVEISLDVNNMADSGLWTPAGEDTTPDGRDGWPHSTTEYDWKGRGKRESNIDGTTDRVTEYEGCGCAGGGVVTVRGEQVPEPGTNNLVRRTRKFYYDTLGRAVKAELLNWGGSVYSTVTTKYDALDRKVRVRQYTGAAPADEPEGEGDGYLTTKMTYDGHGRLDTRHIPQQDENKFTAFTYYNDDRVETMTDARGAKTTYEYYDRGLLKRVSHSAPAGSDIPLPPAINYTYDPAGNRLSMTDGMGRVDYAVDELSRLREETRRFNDVLPQAPLPNNSFKLTYDYNLAGNLKSLTDPYGATVYYGYDKVGQLKDVTGTAYGGVTTYAENAEYRAWGALKHLEYGNGHQMNTTFTPRRQAEEFSIAGGGQYAVRRKYDYYADGLPRYTQDMLDPKFDRLNRYDHAGRISEARSGAEARGLTETNLQNLPYRQDYTFDVFGNVTGRTGKQWTADSNVLYNFTNGRVNESLSDADGRATSAEVSGLNDPWQVRHEYRFDAAGRMETTKQWAKPPGTDTDPDPAERLTSLLMSGRDGDGLEVKAGGFNYQETGEQYSQPTKYLIRSSLLGGQIVTEVNGAGAKLRTIVYAGGAPLAWQVKVVRPQLPSAPAVWWQYADAGGTWLRVFNSGRQSTFDVIGEGVSMTYAELDPLGSDMGGSHYAVAPPLPPQEPSYAGVGFGWPESEGFPMLPSGRQVGCVVDGHEMPCPQARSILEAAGGGGLVDYLGIRGPYAGFLSSQITVSERKHSLKVNTTLREYAELEDGTLIPGAFTDAEGAITYESTDFEVWGTGGWDSTVNSLPQDPRMLGATPLTPQEVDKLSTNLQKVLNDTECGKFITEMLGSLPSDFTGTTRFSGSLLDVFNRTKSSAGFWSRDLGDPAAIANPGTLDITLHSGKTTPFINSEHGWRQLGVTLTLVHELTHLFTTDTKKSGVGHLPMAQAASAAATKMDIDVHKILGLKFPTLGATDIAGKNAEDKVLSNYFGQVLSYACRKVKL